MEQNNRYSNALHGFARQDSGDSQSMGVAYDKNARVRSLQATLSFLGEAL